MFATTQSDQAKNATSPQVRKGSVLFGLLCWSERIHRLSRFILFRISCCMDFPDDVCLELRWRSRPDFENSFRTCLDLDSPETFRCRASHHLFSQLKSFSDLPALQTLPTGSPSIAGADDVSRDGNGAAPQIDALGKLTPPPLQPDLLARSHKAAS